MSSSVKKDVIPIIYWSTWFGTYQWEDYRIDNCNLPVNCKITHDRTKAVDSSVLIFHASDINSKADLPATARKDRAWVYHNAEAPKDHVDIIGLMQYSMTYRLDSDFPWGYFERGSIKRLEERPRKTDKKKRAPIAWIVSNCKANNYRHHFVKELSKWIDVDIYGHCMNNQVFPDNQTTIELIEDYHFYLALENSNCKDYVTEKLYNAYVAGSIPIVDGPSDYGAFIPSTRSVIRVDDFDTPKLLADYIRKVLANKELYESYFEYKKPGGITNKRFLSMVEAYEKGQCNLCQLAYERHIGNPISFYPGKKIFPDNTCIASKHYRFQYSKSLFFLFTCVFLLFVIHKFKRVTCSRRVLNPPK